LKIAIALLKPNVAEVLLKIKLIPGITCVMKPWYVV